jgi:hypothetical protein
MVSDSKRKVSSVKKSIKLIFTALTAIILLTTATACGSSSESSASGITLKAGETISFAEDIAGGGENGWSLPDNGGTWSASDEAQLSFSYEGGFDRGLNFKISMASFVNDKNPNIDLTLLANNLAVSNINFNQTNFEGEYSVNIGPEVLEKTPGKLRLMFRIANAAVPKDLGLGEDLRKLGVFLINITPSAMS